MLGARLTLCTSLRASAHTGAAIRSFLGDRKGRNYDENAGPANSPRDRARKPSNASPGQRRVHEAFPVEGLRALGQTKQQRGPSPRVRRGLQKQRLTVRFRALKAQAAARPDLGRPAVLEEGGEAAVPVRDELGPARPLRRQGKQRLEGFGTERPRVLGREELPAVAGGAKAPRDEAGLRRGKAQALVRVGEGPGGQRELPAQEDARQPELPDGGGVLLWQVPPEGTEERRPEPGAGRREEQGGQGRVEPRGAQLDASPSKAMGLGGTTVEIACL